jgi:hypothetical protein
VIAAAIFRKTRIKTSIVHVDAAREYEEVLRDIREYWPLIEPGGFLIGDDYLEFWPGVVRAAGQFSAEVVKPLHIKVPKWILAKS